MNHQNHLCVLLGSGFSKPAGLPLAREINDFFIRDNSETLLKFSSGEWKWADFANEAELNNGQLNFDHLSYGYILNEFTRAFIENSGSFSNYEEYYQFILDMKTDDPLFISIYAKALQNFCTIFPSYPESSYLQNAVRDLQRPNRNEFLSLFNHLIADLLYCRKKRDDFIENYSAFFSLIKSYTKASIITLNHDVLLEYLMEQYGFPYSDGFQSEGSILISDSGIPIKTFIGDFSRDTPIIKLHGSIDMYQYPFYLEEGSALTSLHEYQYYKPDNFHDKHMVNRIDPESGKIVQRFHWNIIPQFITGTRKDEIIATDEMYGCLYSEFEKSIHSADSLLIVGYSFSDEHVNQKICTAVKSNIVREVINVNPRLLYPDDFGCNKISNFKDIQDLNQFKNE